MAVARQREDDGMAIALGPSAPRPTQPTSRRRRSSTPIAQPPNVLPRPISLVQRCRSHSSVMPSTTSFRRRRGACPRHRCGSSATRRFDRSARPRRADARRLRPGLRRHPRARALAHAPPVSASGLPQGCQGARRGPRRVRAGLRGPGRARPRRPPRGPRSEARSPTCSGDVAASPCRMAGNSQVSGQLPAYP